MEHRHHVPFVGLHATSYSRRHELLTSLDYDLLYPGPCYSTINEDVNPVSNSIPLPACARTTDVVLINL